MMSKCVFYLTCCLFVQLVRFRFSQDRCVLKLTWQLHHCSPQPPQRHLFPPPRPPRTCTWKHRAKDDGKTRVDICPRFQELFPRHVPNVWTELGLKCVKSSGSIEQKNLQEVMKLKEVVHLNKVKVKDKCVFKQVLLWRITVVILYISFIDGVL